MFNSKKIKKVICLILLFLLLLSINSLAVVSPTKDFFVNDYAGVLTEETKKYIIETNNELQQKTGAQIVVITLSNLEGKSIEEYATEVFRKFGIGDSEKNNGVLLLCSTAERLFRIEVGYGLEGTLTDGKTGMIQDEYIIPYLKNNDYDQGIKNGFNAILNEITNEYDIKISSQEEAQKINNVSTLTSEESRRIIIAVMIVMTMIFSIIIGCIIREKSVKFKSILLVLYVCFLLGFINNGSYDNKGVEEINIVERILIFLINSIILLIYTLLKPRKKRRGKLSSCFFDNFWDNNFFGGGSSGNFSGGGGGSLLEEEVPKVFKYYIVYEF